MRFKIEFRPDILKFIGISSAGIFIGLLLFFFIEPMGVLGFILILGGFIGLLIALFAASKPGCDLVHDERLVKNAEKAGYHSFLILMSIAAIIVFLRMFKLSPSLTPSYELFDAANSLYLIGLLSYIILYRYINGKVNRMKAKEILNRQCLTGILFTLWGILWLALYYENLFGKLLSGFFIVFGLFIFVKNYNKLKKGDYEDILIDERMELNMLRASKKGFLFMLTATGFLLALFGLRVINEILFVAFMGPVFAIASILYVWTYHRYEKGADENQD